MDIGKTTSTPPPSVAATSPTTPKVTPEEVIKKERSANAKIKKFVEHNQKVINKLKEASSNQQEMRAELKEILKDLMNITESYNKRLDFEVKEGLNQVVVRVIDNQSGEVLREYPSEEMQKLHLRIREAVGIIFDEKI